MSTTVRVGVGAFIFRDNTFVTGHRKGSHGAGCLQLPGGHLEVGESFEDCAAREILEETGLAVQHLRFLTATNDYFEAEGKHYVTIFMTCQVVDESAEPEVLEPEKCNGWTWTTWEELSAAAADSKVNLFLPLRNLLKQREGLDPASNVVGTLE